MKITQWMPRFCARIMAVLLIVLTGLMAGAGAAKAADPNQGPGGPILVITSGTATFGKYYAEILRNEGFNEFAVADLATVSATTLAAYDVAILAPAALSASQVTMFTDWVGGGGNLIAMRPDPQLYSLLGLTSTGSTLSDQYLRFDTSKSPGNGLVGETIQFHGGAALYGLTGGSTSLATLYSSATTATANPAASLRSVGSNGGQAAAFAYDLATSVVYSRQGNPAWAAQERDGLTPIRSDDKFYGAASTDPQPDWVNLTKVAIPQADEQQRFLANLILQMNLDKKPLPRFWYFPRAKKAVVIMTGDDHARGGTAGRFDQFIAASPAGCSVDNWECVRGTSYVYPGTPIANSASYDAAGFEIGLHVNTNCADFTPTSLDNFYSTQKSQWASSYPGLPAPITERHHCLVWSDWITGAKTELKHGIRLDTSYYYWPSGWIQNRPGFFTGSGMPMRFMELNGAFVDVYKAATQMTDESGQTYPFTIDSLLDRAIGATGYYGAFVINAHTDFNPSSQADATVASAKARGVPIVSSRQMLQWLDGRNDSSFSALAWNGNVLNFTVTPGTGANGLQVLLPSQSSSGALTGLTRNGTAVPFTVETLKGITYASFPASGGGAFVATYAQDTTAPTVTATSPANGATGVSATAAVTATFSEAIDSATLNGNTFTLQGPDGAVSATLSYDAGTRTASLKPNAALAFGATYTATVKGGTTDPRIKDLSGNALANTVTWSFTTGSGPSCPCSAWSTTTVPTNPADPDTGSVELGVKFKSDFNGFITGIRFYKASTNTGTHTGTLWSSTGQQLAQATFINETASGWQQVNFATPVAITANTVYVASYHAPNGHYAADSNYFATTGVDNPPIHLLASGTAGGNGVYAYNTAPVFPSSTYQATNYWVDVVFTVGTGPGPTPTLASIAVTPTTATIAVGATQAYTATGTYSDGNTQNLTSQVTWTSSNPAVATISSTGLATAQSTGTTTFSAALSGVTGTATLTVQTAGSACASPANAIVAENCQPGNPKSEWDVSGAGDSTIQGFATDISVNKGTTVNFKIKTTASSYRLDIYRMGYYGGMGARKVATVNPSVALPQSQPNCLTNAATGLIDCGNWAVSASWPVPANATSGIYFARAVRTDTGGASHIVFIVRDDAGNSNVLFQTSDTTWQAYNTYGGNSLYVGSPAGRAYKVSYNRPFNTRSVDTGHDWVFNAEYPMVRWLEANGFDVSYFTGVDSDRRGTLIRNHKVFMSVAHDEYWSGAQRANVEAARSNGVHLAFFSGNEVFWKTRWENSIDGSNTAYRTLVCYKETHANQVIDPADPPTWTGTWRDPRFSPPADGGRPENALTGTIFKVNSGTSSIRVPSADGKMRFWRNTAIANLASGSVATLPFGTLGYEWDEDSDNGVRPAGLIQLSTATVTNIQVLQDYGSTYGAGSATHHLTLYRDNTSRALVFGAGTMQWSWGLDSNHDLGSAAPDPSMQQATVNLLADMGVQPATLQTGLSPATASTDTAAPTSAITSPAAAASLPVGSPVTITGTATDTGGGTVGGVEVSVDGGTTWHPASGRATWSYAWTPSSSGTVTIKSRAVDDSGNLETPGAGVTVTVGSGGGGTTCTSNCTIFATAAPVTVDGGPDSSVEVGVKFRSDVGGTITGIRFYKAGTNTGTHVGNLWSSTGQQLAQVTFINETASGWQQMNFTTPVTITANTVYVVSYHANTGHYSADQNYFTSKGVDSPPLHALQSGVSGLNGVYAYGSTSRFPNQSWRDANYWVDVVFSSSSTPTDTTAPTVSITAPTAGATVSDTVAVTATASDNVGVTGVQFLLDGAALGAEDTAAPYSVSWDTTAIANGTHVLSARARDAAGNLGTAANVTVTVSNAGSQPLPSPWASQDIGTVGVAGSASYTNGTFTVAGSGNDIWGTSDNGHFAYQPLPGDGTITARLASIQNTGVWAKAGLMIRETLAANARNAMILLNPQQGVWFQFRSASGGTTQEIFGGADLPPRWIRLRRSGTTFTAYKSSDGINWTVVGTTTITMASNVYVGLAVNSYNNATLNTSLFDNVSVTAP